MSKSLWDEESRLWRFKEKTMPSPTWGVWGKFMEAYGHWHGIRNHFIKDGA